MNSNIIKTIKRIVLPFFLVEGFILLVYLITGNYEKASDLIGNGGDGPGAYYPYIYLQLWVLASPLFYLTRVDKYYILTFLISIVVCVVTCSYIIDNNIYRFLFVRYIFLIVPASLLIVGVNRVYLSFMLFVSIAYLIIYHNTNFEPCVDERWEPQQWPAYFYTMTMFR